MIVSVYYCFPRSGGTLLNQCLLCHPHNMVLSEINPAGSVHSPLEQASQWFGMPAPREQSQLGDSAYIDAIKRIGDFAGSTQRKLVIRDWTGINFLPHLTPWNGAASEQVEQRLYLRRAGFELRECLFLRRSEATYRSLVRSIPECAKLSASEFARIYRAYLAQTHDMTRFNLEAFSQSPAAQLARICEVLDIAMPAPGFEQEFAQQHKVTGNTGLSTSPGSARWKSIVSQAAEPTTKSSPLFAELDAIAGYE